MKESLYAAFLRLPTFKGKGRLAPIIRDAFFKPRPRRTVHNLRILLDPLEWEQASILRDVLWEPLTTTLFGQLLTPGAIYLDVGAHIGYHTLVARHHIGPTGGVFAVEPQPYNCDRILENWACNDFENVVVYVAAAGPQSGSISLPHQPSTGRSQLSVDQNETKRSRRFRVPLVTLADLISESDLTKVHLLKIDVEGFEAHVLEGLGDKISIVENIILEILPAALSNDFRSPPVLELLSRSGFNRWRTVEGVEWRIGDCLPENNLWAAR